MLGEVEVAGPKQGIRQGNARTNSRSKQYFDPAFPPSAASLGYIANLRMVDPNGWKTSVEMNLDSKVFSGGSDPDDVQGGEVRRPSPALYEPDIQRQRG